MRCEEMGMEMEMEMNVAKRGQFVIPPLPRMLRECGEFCFVFFVVWGLTIQMVSRHCFFVPSHPSLFHTDMDMGRCC